MNSIQNTIIPILSEHNPTKDEKSHSPLSPPKTLQQLNLMDGFFNAATEKDEAAIKIAKIIIQRATGIKVDQIEIEREKSVVGIFPHNRGIRMDLYMKEKEPVENVRQ